MVTINSAENALKSVYLGVVANQLNVNANPLLSKIKKSNKDVWGKEIIKLAPYGINGGIGAGSETGSLPSAFSNNYAQFKAELKNLYGKIELSDKVIRASQNNIGAFVNILSDEMEGLVKASSFNLGRMLFGDGSGQLATISAHAAGVFTCDKVKNLIEGMVVDIYNGSTKVQGGLRITFVDRVNKKFSVDASSVTGSFASGHKVYVQGSKDMEISGLGKIFSNSTTLYGLTRADYKWLSPFQSSASTEISDNLVQNAIDYLDENVDSKINYITCSSAVRRAYQEYLGAFRRNIEVMNLEGGFKAISHNGIPVVADRFVDDDTMFLLNTNDFTLHELCDWNWLEGEDGKILKQNAGFPTYSATLVKYAELICDKPNGQAKISGISSNVTSPFETIGDKIDDLTQATEGNVV